MKRILGIGNALVDIMTIINSDNVLEKFSLPKGSMTMVDGAKSVMVKNETIEFEKSCTCGGSAANTIHGLAMLGVPTGFIGSIGNDEMGDFFEKDMKDAGVDTILQRQLTQTGTAVALISPDSERTFATHLGAAVELYTDMLKENDFTNYDMLYFEGYLIYNKPLVEKACCIAKENNMKIAMDLSSYNVVLEKLDDFREIVGKYIDIVFANEEEAKAFTGQNTLDALKEISLLCETVVLKAGKEGSWIKRGEETIKIDAIPAQSKDTTGAGDLYAAGFLYGLAMNEPLEKCGHYGAILSGKVIEVVGAKMDYDRWNEIKRIMNSNNDQKDHDYTLTKNK
jgi:sugar/nucleoside kinase (ribokinase family)